MLVLIESLRFADALQVADDAISVMNGSKGPKVYDDYCTYRVWLLDGRSQALFGLERWDDAVAQLVSPRTNGKAERFIQTCLREWAYARAYHHSYRRRDALPTWLHGYNWHRPHMSLAAQPPINRLGLSRNNVLRLHS
jgi:transposase InsO family protein